MIVLLTLLTHTKVTTGGIATLLQRPVDETQSVLDRLAASRSNWSSEPGRASGGPIRNTVCASTR